MEPRNPALIAMPDSCLFSHDALTLFPAYLPDALAVRRFFRHCLFIAGKSGVLLIFFLCLSGYSFVFPGLAGAAERQQLWETVIAKQPAAPRFLIAVDKSRQQMALFERSSPLRLARTFPCTTGQSVGDKMVQGDLKTPEGVYFVVQRISSGLDFIKYGNEAYTLNYPNPMDRLRGKTGYGIWIHGRGEPLTPLQTEGCISLNNTDLAQLAKLLPPGTPVVLSNAFSYTPDQASPDIATVAALEKNVIAWAQSWSERSQAFFAFYDKQAYGIAQGEEFSAFQAQKEGLFRRLPWIRTTVRDIHVLKGPGYWVSWFYQIYTAPNLTTQGIRRLYWSADSKGELKIIGMEWQPGLNTPTLLASADDAVPPLESGSPPPFWPPSAPGTVAWYSSRQENAPQEASANSGSAGLSAERPADRSPTGQPHNAAPPTDLHLAAAPAPVEQGSLPAPSIDYVEDPKLGKMARPSPQAVELAKRLAAERAKQMAGKAGSALPVSEKASAPLPPDHPARALPPALSAQKLTPEKTETPSAQAAASAATAGSSTPERQLRQAGASDPAAVMATAPNPEKLEASSPPQMEQSAETGARAALEKKEADQAAAQARSAVSQLIEDWRQAWENGHLDAYVAYYAPKARQGGRTSKTAIRRHKEKLWAKAKPVSVILADVRVTTEGKRLLGAMRQEYTDNRGDGDIGLKTLTFEHINGAWLITQEDWSLLSDETGH